MPTKPSLDLFDGPLRLMAGPGAGKTQTLVDLYTEVVASGRAQRGQILVLTFSTAAAGEIADRVDQRLGDSYDEAWISTFHSFCARLLRDHRPDPSRLLMSGFQEWIAMRRVLEEIDLGALGGLARVARHETFAQDALAFVALLKQNRVGPAEFALAAESGGTSRLRALARIYSHYQARIEAASLKDFRDLVADAAALLEARPDVLNRLRKRFLYVLVDEFQDVDPAQFWLLRTLAPPEARPRLLVAGDPDQSIYGFRGTVPQLLSEEFERIYGSRVLHLGKSRRCPPDVLAAGHRLLEAKTAGDGTSADPRPASQPSEAASEADGAAAHGLKVAYEANGVDEAFFVAREIRRLLLEDPALRPRDFAILLRSTTSMSASFEEAVRALGLPYEVRGMGAMARNEVVRFLLTYLRALAAPSDSESLERLLASSLSGVGHRTAGRLRRHAIEEGRSFSKVVRHLMYRLQAADPERWPLPWVDAPETPPAAQAAVGDQAAGDARGQDELPDYARFMSEPELESLHGALRTFHQARGRATRLPLAALAYTVLMETGVLGRLLDLPLPEADRREALGDLRGALAAFTELEEVWERLHGTRPQLVEIASRLESWIARAIDEAEPAPGSRDAVQILTVHQSKGLEFEVVFLSGFAQGLFPLAAQSHPVLEEEDQRWLERNLSEFRPSWPKDAGAHVAEEARLAYVGMTRARRRLYLTYAAEYDRPTGPSTFLEPAAGQAPRVELSRSTLGLDAGNVLTLAEAETLLHCRDLTARQEARLAALGADFSFLSDPAAGRPFEPQGEPPAGVNPGHFSATTLNDYLKCPRLYWYNHHPGLVAPPRGVEMERGSFLHRVLEDFHTQEPEWRPLAPELQREWLEKALERQLPAYLDRVEAVLERKAEEQEVRRILGNYIRFATSSQPIRRLGTLMTEKRFTLHVDGAEIRGKIDRVNDTGDGTCEIVDYKTGRGQGPERAFEAYFGPELHDVQLVMYYLACMDGVDEEGLALGLLPRFLSLWYPKDQVYGQMRQVLFPLGGPVSGLRDWMQRPVGVEDLERGRERVTRAMRRIAAGDFAPDPKPNLVGTCLSWFGCPHSAICPFGGQPAE